MGIFLGLCLYLVSVVGIYENSKDDFESKNDKEYNKKNVEYPFPGNAFKVYYFKNFCFLVLAIPFIAHTPNGYKVFGGRWFIFNFHTKSSNIYIYNFFFTEIATSPNLS